MRENTIDLIKGGTFCRLGFWLSFGAAKTHTRVLQPTQRFSGRSMDLSSAGNHAHARATLPWPLTACCSMMTLLRFRCSSLSCRRSSTVWPEASMTF